jgi:hypothetical protein
VLAQKAASHLHFLDWKRTEKENHAGDLAGHRSSIALHPFLPDDSGQAWDLSPNRRELQSSRRFRRTFFDKPFSPGHPTLLGNAGPATRGVRASTKNTFRLLESSRGCQIIVSRGWPDEHELNVAEVLKWRVQKPILEPKPRKNWWNSREENRAASRFGGTPRQSIKS